MRRLVFRRCPVLAAALLVLAGCSDKPPQERAIGEAFAGPATLKIRKDVDLRSPEAASVKHGDKLSILRRRRRFVRVRTEQGVEGWTDIRQLLSTAQMDALNQLAETAKQLPSHGAATAYEPLNVHTDPNRFAPSFYRMKEKEAVDVLGYQNAPRTPMETRSLLPPPAATKPKAQKKQDTTRVPPPPRPPAPTLPDDWEELSKTASSEDADDAPAKPEPPPAKPVPIDEWALVRLSSGRAGWVLTSMLRMSIPDDVAQYSEGHRITSYFSMGEVNDGGQVKHHWLWTTITTTRQPYQFDSFRYFIWNSRRHRYETAYIEKNLRGFFPVQLHPVRATVGGKQESVPGFSLTVEDDKGVRWRRSYSAQIYRVALVSKEQVEAPPVPANQPAGLRIAQEATPAPAPPQPGLWARMKASVRRMFGK